MFQVRVPITRSVDDSAIERSSAFKQLASWGGFRRHFIDGTKEDEQAPRGEADQASAINAQPTDEEWKLRLQEQLLAKRAEILATQKKLESLSLEQQELEMLYTRTT